MQTQVAVSNSKKNHVSLSLAKEAAAALKRIEAKRGKLSSTEEAQALVAEARKYPSSALHRHFQWDDKKCGHKYRLWQAFNLIGSIRLVVTAAPGARPVNIRLKPYRGTYDSTAPGAYGDSEEEVRRLGPGRAVQIQAEEALSRLLNWRAQFPDLPAFDPVYKAIDAVRSTWPVK